MRIFLIVAMAALVAPASTAAAKGEAKKKERQICKFDELTGSRVARPRKCLTAAQWDAQNAVEDGLDKMNAVNRLGARPEAVVNSPQ